MKDTEQLDNAARGLFIGVLLAVPLWLIICGLVSVILHLVLR